LVGLAFILQQLLGLLQLYPHTPSSGNGKT
jgi:hypothetical protein